MSVDLNNVIAFITIFGVLVFLHEAGHFLAAKWYRVRVEVFSLGFGPRLFGWRRRETDYRVSLVPLGGYVRMVGEQSDAEWVGDPRDERPPTGDGGSLLDRSRTQRLIIMVAGAAINLVLAVLILAGVNVAGRSVPAYLNEVPRVGTFRADSPAALAGLARGDRVVAVDGREVAHWEALQQAVLLNPGRTLNLTLERAGARLERQVEVGLPPEGRRERRYGIGDIGLEEPAYDVEVVQVSPGSAAAAAGLRAGDRVLAIAGETILQTRDVARLIEPRAGVRTPIEVRRGSEVLTLDAVPGTRQDKGFLGLSTSPTVVVQAYGPLAAFEESVRENVRRTGMFFTVLGKLVTGSLSVRAVSGPVDMFLFSGEALRQGLRPYFDLMALFSLQLGILNLLPIPFLDGGHIAILLVEGVRRRDLSLRLKERLLQAGFVVLLLFMGLVLYTDIAKNLDLFRGWLR